MRFARWMMGCVAAFALVAAISCQPRTEGGNATVDATKAASDSLAKLAQLERGQKGFLAYCSMCHGDGGNGDGDMAASLAQSGVKIARLNDLYMMGRLTTEQVTEVIRKGGGHTGRSNVMPAWGEKLSDDLIADITAYVVQLPAENPAIPLSTLEHYMAAPEGVPADGRKLYVRHCSACHGEAGKGDGPTAASLKADHQTTVRDLTDSAYLGTRTDQELFATISLGGGHFKKATYMPAWTVTLSPEQIKDLVAYVRSISNTAPRP